MILIIVTVLITVSAFVMLVNAETDESSAQDHISAGACGRNVNYCLYSDGTLEIFGSGEMYQYGNSHAPWYKYRDNITKIVISPVTDSLITKLGASAFRDCKNVTEITLPITLNSVVSDKYPAFSA